MKALFVIGILLLVPFTAPVAPAQTTKAPYQLEWWLYNTGNETIDEYRIVRSPSNVTYNASVSRVYTNYSYVYGNITSNVTIIDQWLYDVQTGFVVGWNRDLWDNNGTVLHGNVTTSMELLDLQVNSTVNMQGQGWYDYNGSLSKPYLKINITQQITRIWEGNITVNKRDIPVTYFDSTTVNGTYYDYNSTYQSPPYGYWGAVSNVTQRPVVLGYGAFSESNLTLSANTMRYNPAPVARTEAFQAYKLLLDFWVPEQTSITSSIDSITTSTQNSSITENTPLLMFMIFWGIIAITYLRKKLIKLTE